jgi:hypothetical protein
MMIWTRRRREELHARVVRLLRADLRETREQAAQLAADRVAAIKRADTAEAEAQIAREALTAGHRDLLAENVRLASEIDLLRRDRNGLRSQLDNALGRSYEQHAAIDAGSSKGTKL